MNKRNRFDYFGLIANLALFITISFVGYHIIITVIKQRDIITQLNSLQINSPGPEKSKAKLYNILEETMALKSTKSEKLLQVMGISFPNINEHCAVIYKLAGDKYTETNDLKTVRNYTLSLTNDPNIKHLAFDLGFACMRTGNYELGLFAGELHTKESGKPSLFLKYFKKHKK